MDGKAVTEVYNPFTIGGLAQLARALAWHARGHRFDPDILHISPKPPEGLPRERDL